MPNRTIGMLTCPVAGQPAAVRKDKGGKLYWISAAGKITPNLPDGQQWILQHAVIWGEAGDPPADAPGWIRDGLSFAPSREPVNEPRPAPEPEPSVTDPEPEPELEPAPESRRGLLDEFFGGAS